MPSRASLSPSRWVATQADILRAGLRRFRAIFDRAPRPPPRSGTFPYLGASVYRWLPWMVLLSLPADALIVAVALPEGWDALGWVLLGATVYTFGWTVGVVQTMRERPHEVSGRHIMLNNGALASTSFDAGAIASLSLHPGFSPGSPHARRFMRNAGVLLTGPGPFVVIHLAEPVVLRHVASVREVRRLLVPADDPAALHAALAHAWTGASNDY